MPEHVIGPYRIISVLGQAPHASVYKAWQQTVGRAVALKVLHKPGPDALRALQLEAQLTANLSDPRVRQVYDVGQTPDGQVYIALQYADLSLRDLLNQRKALRRPFTRDEIADVLQPIAGVLDELHRRGLAHLDIKPENILLFSTGPAAYRAALADFGIAQKAGAPARASTPLYASPEQAAGDRPVGGWSDIYSLGVVAYEMAAGRPPFTASMDVVVLRQHLEDAPPPLRQLRRDLDADLERAIARALSKDPRKRFAAAGEFGAALRPRPRAALSGRLGRWAWPAAGLAFVLVAVSLASIGLQGAARPAWVWPTATWFVLTATELPKTIAPLATLDAWLPAAAPTTTIMPTRTPSPTRAVPPTTPTPTRLVEFIYSPPLPGGPLSGASAGRNEVVAFTWISDRALGADERYRFRFWRAGQVVDESYTQDLWRHAKAPAGPGEYEWSVDIVRVDAAGRVTQALSPASDRWQVTWK